MQRYIWSAPELTGTRSLTFTSSDATASYGPGISDISLYLGGQQASYTNYLTHCTNTGVTSPQLTIGHTKFIRNGQLLVVYEGKTYNTQGMLVD
jgi:hypothetical protein